MKQWYMTGIYHEYAGYIPVLCQFWFNEPFTAREMMKMLSKATTLGILLRTNYVIYQMYDILFKKLFIKIN